MTNPYSSITYDDYLEHYGVKGMKWGVRKDRKTKSASPKKVERSEKKAARRENKAIKFDSKIDKLDIKVSDLKKEISETPKGAEGARARRSLKKKIKSTEKTQEHLKKDAQAVRDGKLTSNQKKAIVGGVVVAGVLAAGYTAVALETGELNAVKMRGESFLKGQPFSFKKNEMFSKKDLSPEAIQNLVVKDINPNYDKPGGQINCRRCTFAYELRRRGFDVTATTTTMGVGHTETGLINALTPKKRNINSPKSLSSMVRGAGTDARSKVKRDNRKNPAYTKSVKGLWTKPDKIYSAFKDQPNGARGEIVFAFSKFGHSMAYEIINGEPYIFDAQKAKTYKLNESGMDSLKRKWGVPTAAEITRLDNVELDQKFLARWATNTKR